MKGRKKRLLAGTACAALLAAAAVGGSLAYFTDTDSDVNVMTMGNVQIEQIEQEWNADGTELVGFTQNKPIAPSVGALGWKGETENGGAYRQFTMENVVDKYVSVKNTGKSDAYVRTVFALEMGDLGYNELADAIGLSVNSAAGTEFPGLHWQWTDDFVAEIDGKNYNIMVAVHDVAVEPGGTTIPSLLQVYLNSAVTNEVTEKIDGNDNGKYDILVVSQAVQTAGFDNAGEALDAAFGDITTQNHPWVKTEYAESQEDFAEAINNGADTVILSEGTYTLPSSVAGKKITVVGNGEETVFDFTKTYNTGDASITFENLKIQGKNENVMSGFGIQHTTGDIVYKNCTFDGAVTNEYYGSVTYINCTFTGTGYITTYAVKSATFEGCTFDKADSRAVLVYSHGDNPVVVKIDDCTFKAAAKATTWAGDWTAAIEIDTTNIPTLGTTVDVNGCTHDANYSGLVRDKSAAGKANAVVTVDGVTTANA